LLRALFLPISSASGVYDYSLDIIEVLIDYTHLVMLLGGDGERLLTSLPLYGDIKLPNDDNDAF